MADPRLSKLVAKTEDEEESTFVRKVRRAGFLTRKMNGRGFIGWPDRLIEGDEAHCTTHAYIEFKRPGKYKDPNDGLSANQADIIAKLRALGKKVLVTDSAEEALEWIHETLRPPRISS